MALYLLQLSTTPKALAFNFYDRPLAAVVRAESETEARQIAAREPVGNGLGCGEFVEFLDPEIFECEELRPDGPSGLIICDVHEG